MTLMGEKKKRKKTPLKQRKANENSMYWRNKADDAWSEEIRKVGYCEKCGRRTSLEAHHLIGRTRLKYRHDLSNGVCLCSWCHKRDPEFSPHVDSFGGEKFNAWLEAECPGQWEWFQKHKEDKRQKEKTYKQCYNAIRERK